MQQSKLTALMNLVLEREGREDRALDVSATKAADNVTDKSSLHKTAT